MVRLTAPDELRMRGSDEWRQFWNGLSWRPIEEYDRASGMLVVLANEDKRKLGFWGNLPADFDERGYEGGARERFRPGHRG